MKHILLICILILSACNQTKKGIGQIVKTDTVYITKGNQLDIILNMDSVMDIAPKGFACFNQPRVFIKYKQKVNGYSVKVMWLQYGEVGKALFFLEKGDKRDYIFTHSWSDAILYDKYFDDGILYSDKTVIELDYTPKAPNEKYLSEKSPFFFSDVDFDGEDEFVINLYNNGSRGSNTYEVYEISYGFELKTEAPFTELENGHCEFNPSDKTITITGSAGFSDWVKYTYQSVCYDEMYWNVPKKCEHFVLVESYVIDRNKFRKHRRNGDKLELIEEGVLY